MLVFVRLSVASFKRVVGHDVKVVRWDAVVRDAWECEYQLGGTGYSYLARLFVG